MTPLTRVKFNENSRLLLRPVILIRLAVLLLLAIVPAMGLTYLRFQTRDMQIETSKLQKERQRLATYKSNLVSQVEELKRYDRMREYAQTKLGLRECPPEQTARIALSVDTVDRWSDVMARATLRRDDTPQSAEQMLAMVGGKVISWSTVSMAHEPDEAQK